MRRQGWSTCRASATYHQPMHGLPHANAIIHRNTHLPPTSTTRDDGNKPYLGTGHIPRHIFNLTRVRLFNPFQGLRRTSRDHDLVRLLEQVARDGCSDTLTCAGYDEDLGRCHICTLLSWVGRFEWGEVARCGDFFDSHCGWLRECGDGRF